jgi:hypothetical protein
MEKISKFQRWYDKNKQALNAKRQHKYRTDPAYRAKILEYQRSQRKAKAAQRQYKETLFGQVVRAYSIREASQIIKRQVQTLTLWEKKGFIPPTIFGTAHRFYTHHQVMLLRELVSIVTKAYAKRINNGKVKAAIEAQRAKIFAHWYELPDALQN